MNDKKVKQLRRIIFGGRAFRGTKEYVAVRHERKSRLIDIPNSGGLVVDATPRTVMIKPETPHAWYRALKRTLERRAA
jgi:hypothetical protein